MPVGTIRTNAATSDFAPDPHIASGQHAESGDPTSSDGNEDPTSVAEPQKMGSSWLPNKVMTHKMNKVQRQVSNLVVNFQARDDVQPTEKHIPVIGGSCFQTIVTSLILLNTLQLGLEADYPDWTDAWFVCEHFFAAAFLMETLVKLLFLRLQYFHDRGNWFDFLLVMMGVFDAWVMPVLGLDGVLRPLSVLRVLRLTRIVRALRLLKMFRPLILIFHGVVAAVKATFWVGIVLLISIYICAIFCVVLVGRTDEATYPGYSKDESVIDTTELMENFNPYIAFGSMGKAMLTLFGVAILAEWPEVVKPIMVKQPQIVCCFVVFVLFITFGVVNIIVAMIVDSVIKTAAELEKHNMESLQNHQMQILQQIQSLVFGMDKDSDGRVTAEELRVAFKSDAMQDLLTKIHLPHGCTPEELIAILDDDGDGALEPDEFTTSIFRLIEGSEFQHRCLLQMNTHEAKSLLKALDRNVRELESKFELAVRKGQDELHKEMSDFRKEMRANFKQLLQTDLGRDVCDLAPECATTLGEINAPETDEPPSISNIPISAAVRLPEAALRENAKADRKLQAVEREIAILSSKVADCTFGRVMGEAIVSSILPGLAAEEDIQASLRAGIKDALVQCLIAARSQLIDGGHTEPDGCSGKSTGVIPTGISSPWRKSGDFSTNSCQFTGSDSLSSTLIPL